MAGFRNFRDSAEHELHFTLEKIVPIKIRFICQRCPFYQKTDHQAGINQHQLMFAALAFQLISCLGLRKCLIKQTGVDSSFRE